MAASPINGGPLFTQKKKECHAHNHIQPTAEEKNSSIPKWDNETYCSLPGHFYPQPPTQPQKRAVIQDGQKDFTIIVDVHDFSPKEISVQIVERGSAVVVKGEHISGNAGDGVMTDVGQTREESRSFCERYSFPSSVDPSTGKWEFSRDETKLTIKALKVLRVPKYINRELKNSDRSMMNIYSYNYNKNNFNKSPYNTNTNVVDHVDDSIAGNMYVNPYFRYGYYQPQTQQSRSYLGQFSY